MPSPSLYMSGLSIHFQPHFIAHNTSFPTTLHFPKHFIANHTSLPTTLHSNHTSFTPTPHCPPHFIPRHTSFPTTLHSRHSLLTDAVSSTLSFSSSATRPHTQHNYLRIMVQMVVHFLNCLVLFFC